MTTRLAAVKCSAEDFFNIMMSLANGGNLVVKWIPAIAVKPMLVSNAAKYLRNGGSLSKKVLYN